MNKIENIDNCTICLDGLDAKKPETTTTCNHIFHTKCIEEWLESQKKIDKEGKCPLCNYVINPITKTSALNTHPIVNFSFTLSTTFVEPLRYVETVERWRHPNLNNNNANPSPTNPGFIKI